MCDKLAASTCLNCSKDKNPPWGKTGCGKTFSWMWDCSPITSTDDKKNCEACNRKLVFRHLVDLLTLVIPFGATYGEWLGGVTDPDLNATIKSFVGTFVVDIIWQDMYNKEMGYSSKQLFSDVLMDAFAVSGWVLCAQIIQDFVLHGAPNRLIAAGVAGLANYYRTAQKPPITIEPEQVGGFVIFATAMASFSGNWSMMGENLMSRFMSTTVAGFFSLFSAINGHEYRNCLIEKKIFPKEVFKAGLGLGVGTSLVGIIADSAFGKPVVSGLAAGFASLYIAHGIFSNKDTFGLCGKIK